MKAEIEKLLNGYLVRCEVASGKMEVLAFVTWKDASDYLAKCFEKK